MALVLLWLGLTLLGTLQTHASGKLHVPRPMQVDLDKIRLEPNFRECKFQGKWYALAVAENTIRNGTGPFQMYSTTFSLNEDHSYNSVTKTQRDEVCENWELTLVPSYVQGQFELGNIKFYPGVQTYTVRVSSTDYRQYALLLLRMKFKNHFFYEATLYGRTKKLNVKMKQRFIEFVTDIGFDEENMMFHDPLEKCIDD